MELSINHLLLFVFPVLTLFFCWVVGRCFRGVDPNDVKMSNSSRIPCGLACIVFAIGTTISSFNVWGKFLTQIGAW